MRNILINTAGILLIIFGVWGQCVIAKRLRSERDTERQNTEVLLDSLNVYRTAEGLNAATVRSLELTLDQFERYRADDAALIETLRANLKDLQRITTAGTKTEYVVETIVKDSIVYRDRVDTLRCIEYRNAWLDFAGCFDDAGRFAGTIESRDSLLIAEHAIRARFLGFLWKTSRIKSRQVEVVSRNPCTTIESVEFITIRK